jgi:hypothetical protein
MIRYLLIFFIFLFFQIDLIGQIVYTYQWYKDGVEIKGATSEKFNPQFSGNYSVRITNQNNCSSEVSTPVAFKCIADKPIVVIGANFKISSNVDANTYSWYLNDVLLAENTKTIKIKKAGKYSLKIINTNGCDSEMSDYVTLAFVDFDNDEIEDSEDNCPKMANPTQKDYDKDGIGDVCDDSDEDGIMDDKDQCQNTIKGSKVDSNGCADYQKDTDGDGLMDDKDDCPTIKNPLTPSIVKISEFELKTSNPIVGESYQWYLDGIAIGGGTLPTLKVNAPGNYTVQTKDANGCKSPISTSLTILILSAEKENKGVSIFPNPFNSVIKMTFDKEFGKEASVSIFDIKGSLIYTKNTVQLNEIIDLSKLSEGTYLLKIKALDGDNKVFIKIIKQY